MVSLNSLMVTDAYEEGGWVEDPPGLKGVALKVRNIGCHAFKRRQSELIDRLPRSVRARGLSQEHSERITEQCIRETLLLGWRGIEHDGAELPYTEEWATKLLASPIFRDAVAWCANVVGTPGASQEQDAKDQETAAKIAAGVEAAKAEQPASASSQAAA